MFSGDRYSNSILFLTALNVVLVSYTFPIAKLLTPEPLFYIDSAFHWYNMVAIGNIAGDAGWAMGYDPFFRAGTPLGLTKGAGSAILPTLIYALFKGSISATVIWKLHSFFSSLLAPILFLLALFLLKLPRRETLVAYILALALSWVSLLRWHHTVGMVGFAFTAYSAVFYVALLVSILEARCRWHWIIPVGILGGFFQLVHPFFFLPVLIGFGSYLVIKRRTIRIRDIAILCASCVTFVLLINSFWIYGTFIADLGYVDPERYLFQRETGLGLLLSELAGNWGHKVYGSRVYPLVAIGVIWALFSYRRANASWYNSTFLAAGVLTILYSAFASHSDTLGAMTEPNRFAPVGYLFLCVPAAAGLCQMARAAFNTNQAAMSVWLARLGGIMVVAIGMFVANEIRREVSYQPTGHYGRIPPQVRGLGPYTEFMIEWIKTNTTSEARVLFEASRGRIHDDAHIAGYLAYTTQREFIGGPYPDRSVTSTSDGRFFGAEAGALTPDQARHYFELYNIGWIIAHAEETKRYLETIDWIERKAEFKKISVYQVNRDFSYFILGSGRVSSRSHNRIMLSDLSGKEVVLKYHYVRGIRTEPETEITPYPMPGDDNPFIRIVDPPSELRITMGD